MAKYRFAYLKNYLKNKLYPYTHSDGVFTDENETTTLTETLNEINSKINNTTGLQSDWNESDITSGSYIKNKPSSLPANGGNADTLDGKSSDKFVEKNDYNQHLEEMNLLLKESTFDTTTGVLSFTRLNGSTISLDIPKSLIFNSAEFNERTNEIIITWSDNSISRIPCEGLVDVYTGSENDVIQITVENNNIAAVIKNDSINRTLLSPEIKTDLTNAQTHMVDNTKHLPEGASNGKILGVVSDNYAWVDMPDNGNSGTTNYTDLTNKPLINGVELNGNKTFSDLGLTADSIGVEEGANYYTHPTTHPASMITEDNEHQFVTIAEKALIGTNAQPNGVQDITFDKNNSVLNIQKTEGNTTIDLSSLKNSVIIGNGNELTPGFNDNMVWKKLELDTTISFNKVDYLGGKFVAMGSTNFIAISDNPPEFTIIDLRPFLSDKEISIYLTNIHYWQNKWYILGWTGITNNKPSYIITTDNFIDFELIELSEFAYGIRGLYFDGNLYSLICYLDANQRTASIKYTSLSDVGKSNLYNSTYDITCNNKVEVTSKMYLAGNGYYNRCVVGNVNSIGNMVVENGFIFRINDDFYEIEKSSTASGVKIIFSKIYSEPSTIGRTTLFTLDNSSFVFSEILGIYCNSKYLITKNGKGIFLSKIDELQNYILSEDNWFKLSASPLTSIIHNFNYIVATNSGGDLVYTKIA